ncbi:MAG: hypothetical protein KF865_02970 [Bdellovibrionaceae bacterium]|nr:hypothetical protein [Pseudobdellovibrionaceae bacterium]
MSGEKKKLDIGLASDPSPAVREKALKAYRAQAELHKTREPAAPLPPTTREEDEILLEDLLDSSRKAA